MKMNNKLLNVVLLTALFFSQITWAVNPGTSSVNSPANIKIDLVLAEQSGEYHPPYVAAWLENDKNKPVRTLALWRTEAKWLKDIRRWWRKIGRKDEQLVDAITSATRGVGTYPLTFKAENDKGQPLAQGSYTLYIEVVRENGGRVIVKQPMVLNNVSASYVIKATAETGKIHIKVTP